MLCDVNNSLISRSPFKYIASMLPNMLVVHSGHVARYMQLARTRVVLHNVAFTLAFAIQHHVVHNGT